MLFSAKAKGFFVDWGEKNTLIARASAASGPLQIEQLRECASADVAGWAKILDELQPKKGGGGYTHANVGICSDQIFIRRASLDVKRLKEANYLTEVSNAQFKIDPELNSVAVLNASDGQDFDPSKATTEKDVLLCGLPVGEALSYQSAILERGVYPLRMELGSLASLAAVVDYLKFTDSNKPTLVLELGSKQTQSFIVSPKGVEASRPISVGLDDMVPVVQKELGLKDEESARKLFFSNTFDFTGMGALLCKRLLKELQSSMGFYEVQTGQSIGQVVCTVLPAKLVWIEAVVASQIGVTVLQTDMLPWLKARQIGIADSSISNLFDARKFALSGLMINFNSQLNATVS
jgi:hypothetical protein